MKLALKHLSIPKLNKESATSFGCYKSNEGPMRELKSKYFIPKQLWATDYPSYYSGAAYMMTIECALQLAEVKDTINLYPIDDVYIGVRFLSINN